METSDIDNFAGKASRLIPQIKAALDNGLLTLDNHKLNNVVRDIQEFQEDPRLLDGLLQHLLPELGKQYMSSLDHETSTTQSAFGRLVYTMAKVRGGKPVAMRLPTDPGSFMPVLNRLAELVMPSEVLPSESQSSGSKVWEEKYSLLLWMSHLITIPFDLVAVSDEEIISGSEVMGIVSSTLPEVARRLMTIVVTVFKSSTREGGPAARLLSRLCLRPDMVQEGLPAELVGKAAPAVLEAEGTTEEEMTGWLQFLEKTIKTADIFLIRPFLGPLQRTLANASLFSKTGSLIVRGLILKAQANLAIAIIEAQAADEFDYVDQVKSELFECLGASEYKIREIAAKSLAKMVAKVDDPNMTTGLLGELSNRLEQDMESANDIADQLYLNSISFDQALLHSDGVFTWTDPNLWHGILFAFVRLIHLTKPTFEALSSQIHCQFFKFIELGLYYHDSANITKTGKCELVREFANLAVWSAAKVYRNLEPPEICRFTMALIDSLCFDSNPKIRLCSIGALQQLLGSHPNAVQDSVLLVQAIADPERSVPGTMGGVCSSIAKISPFYRLSILKGLMGWRGALSHEMSPKIKAGETIKQLAVFEPFDHPQMTNIRKDLLNDSHDTKYPETAWKRFATLHGPLSEPISHARLIRSLMRRVVEHNEDKSFSDEWHGFLLLLSGALHDFTSIKGPDDQIGLSLVKILQTDMDLFVSEYVVMSDLDSYSMTGDQTAILCKTTMQFTANLLNLIVQIKKTPVGQGSKFRVSKKLVDCFLRCVRRAEIEVYQEIPAVLSGFNQLGWPHEDLMHYVQEWIEGVRPYKDQNQELVRPLQHPGLYMALAAAASQFIASKISVSGVQSALASLEPVMQLLRLKGQNTRHSVIGFKALQAFIDGAHSLNKNWHQLNDMEDSDLQSITHSMEPLIVSSQTYEHIKDYANSQNLNVHKDTQCRMTNLAAYLYRQVISAVCVGLEDFTLTDRGDTGADVRVEALYLVEKVWKTGPSHFMLPNNEIINIKLHITLSNCLFRLTFDRIDKVRLIALRLLPNENEKSQPQSMYTCFYPWLPIASSTPITANVSKQETYLTYLLFLLTIPACSFLHRAIVDGFCELVAFGSQSQSLDARIGIERILSIENVFYKLTFIQTILSIITTGLNVEKFNWTNQRAGISSRLDWDRMVTSKMETLVYLGQIGAFRTVANTDWFAPMVDKVLIPAVRKSVATRGKFALRLRLACYDVMRFLASNTTTSQSAVQFFQNESTRLGAVKNPSGITSRSLQVTKDTLLLLEEITGKK